MFALQSITVEGFRGFPARAEFDLDAPVVLALGPNGTGKSSLVCAIEWCLFGQDVETERHTAIRERVSWASRNRTASACLVEMELTSDGETLIVHRSAPKTGKPEFWFRMGSGPKVSEQGKLIALLGGLEIRDFFTAIHLHQESLRGLLLAKPNDRKQDFYRLLGLASLLNQTKAVQDAKIEAIVQDADNEFERFESVLEGRAQSREGDIQRVRSECLSRGLESSELSQGGYQRLWAKLADAVGQFCVEYSIKDCQLLAQPPKEGSIKIAKDRLQKLRKACPVLTGRSEVLAQINALDGLRGAYQGGSAELAAAEDEIKKLPSEERDAGKLQQQVENFERDLKMEKKRRSNVDAKAAALGEALDYFEKSGLKGKAKCPVCNGDIDSVEGLRKHYEKEIKGEIIRKLDAKIKELQAELKKHKEALERIEDFRKDVVRKENSLSAQREKVGKALNRELGPKDDVLALLDAEIAKLNRKQGKLEGQVQKVEESLADIDAQIEAAAKVLELIRLQNDLAGISSIRQLDAYKRTDASRLELERFARTVDALSRTLTEELEQGAQKRLGAVKDVIARTFERLTGRSDFPSLAVSPETKFAAQVEGSGGVADALSVLNQADTNCAALSIFLALATAPSTDHRLGFLVLDDPSQSLDDVHTKRLAEIVGKLSESRQLLVSTIDDGLCSELKQSATKKKIVYRFTEWNPKRGPKVEKV